MEEKIEAAVKKCCAGYNLLPIVIVREDRKLNGKRKHKKKKKASGKGSEEVKRLLAERSKFKENKNM